MSSRSPAGWVSLDAENSDPVSFWMYVAGALQGIEPGVARTLLKALRSPEPPQPRWLFTTLINSLCERDEDFVLVLDDYHALEAPAIHDGIGFIVDHLPPRLHLVISSRADPPLPLARWRARGTVTEIRSREMAFTGEETAGFFETAAGLSLNTRDVALLERRTEGWIAGLSLPPFPWRAEGMSQPALRPSEGPINTSWSTSWRTCSRGSRRASGSSSWRRPSWTG